MSQISSLVRSAELKKKVAAIEPSVRWVDAVLVVPLAFVDFRSWQKDVLVLQEDQLPGVFADAPAKLTKGQVELYVSAMQRFVSSSANVDS